MREYVDVWTAVAPGSAERLSDGAKPFLRRHIRKRLREVRTAYEQIVEAVPEDDPFRAWINRAIESLDRFGKSLGGRSRLTRMKTWLSIAGVVATSPILAWIAHALKKEFAPKFNIQTSLDVFLGFGVGIGSSLAWIVPYLAWSQLRAFHAKRDYLLGGADDGRRRNDQKRNRRRGRNCYELENTLFALLRAGEHYEGQLDESLATAVAMLLAVTFELCLLSWGAVPAWLLIALGSACAVAIPPAVVVRRRARDRRWAGASRVSAWLTRTASSRR